MTDVQVEKDANRPGQLRLADQDVPLLSAGE